jgi:SCP-2 sterol transfer family
MSGATERFFDELDRRGYEPLLGEVNGTMRWDIACGRSVQHWTIEIEMGTTRVMREQCPADCVLRVDRDVFERLATGEANAYAAWLRHDIAISGVQPELFDAFQRVFPAPPMTHDPRPGASNER